MTGEALRAMAADAAKGMACASERSSPALSAGTHRAPGAIRAYSGLYGKTRHYAARFRFAVLWRRNAAEAELTFSLI